jgi:ubiquinone/menaquinone biosynthesis C-methylase UbiE
MSSLMHALARQARRPNGLFGNLFGLSMSRINKQANTWVISLLDVAEDDDVLEIGFGPGQAIQMLTAVVRTGLIAGVDFSETMVRQAKKRNRRAIEHGSVVLKVGEAAALPYPDRAFDKVFCVNVIYFWEHAETELSEIVRVLRPGGRLAIYMGDSSEMAKVKITQTGIFNLYSEAQAVKLLQAAGFTDVESFQSAISQGPLSKGVCVVGVKPGETVQRVSDAAWANS